MANEEHLQILNHGVETWNEWRSKIPTIKPDLSGTKLNRLRFIQGNLSGVNLSGSHLESATLNNANLAKADLSGAHLEGANLHAVDLRSAKLCDVDLSGAYLSMTYLRRADLRDAILAGANLIGANFIGANLSGTDFDRAIIKETIFADVDLSAARNLMTVRHGGPSEISLSTFYLSEGSIPEVFLQGCGVPEDFITYMRSLIRKAIDFYSCFISYTTKDEEFARRLHADLQSKGVRVWFAPHDMKIGAHIRPTIDESIRVYDKLLLVLSEASVSSQWVEQEVETALAKEREQEGRTVLFPIRVDDAVIESKAGWPALLKNTRNVGDFTRWKDHDYYQKALDKLLRDLKAGGA